MKRKCWSCLVVIFLFLTGCQSIQNTDYLFWQGTPFEIKGNVEFHGSTYEVGILSEKNIFEIVLLSGDLEGLTFRRSKEDDSFSENGQRIDYSLVYDGSVFPLGEESVAFVDSIYSMFSLSQEDMISVDVEYISGMNANVIRFRKDEEECVMYIHPETLFPVRIEWVGNEILQLNIHEFKKSEEK